MTSKSVISGTGLTIGTKNAAVSCFYGTASLTEVSISCFSGYVEGPTFSCVADACGGTITEANAHSTATSQSVSGNWTRSDAPGLCTWDCNSGFGWDPGTTTCEASVDGTCGTASKTYAFADSSFGSDTLCGNGTPSPARAFPAAGTSVTWTCGGTWKGNASPTCTASRSDPANCSASMQTVNGRTYSVGAFDHGATASADSSSPVTGGARTYSQTFACSDGAVKTEGTETGPNLTCTAAGYALVGGSCVPNSCNAIKVAYPASADGVYTIDSDGAEAGMTLSAYCDMTTDGGGWTMVAKSVYKPGLTASG